MHMRARQCPLEASRSSLLHRRSLDGVMGQPVLWIASAAILVRPMHRQCTMEQAPTRCYGQID